VNKGHEREKRAEDENDTKQQLQDRMPSIKSKRKTHLGQGAALTDRDLVALVNITESGGDVGTDVLVALLETVVLADEVEVVTADNQGAATKAQEHEEQDIR
jgi:hypothetical protein